MSAIFGIFNLDGQPVGPESLDVMKQRMAYWGPDGSGTWFSGPIGLGHLLMYNTPESLHETLPLQSETGDLVLTAGARLDNRDDLFRALNVPHAKRAHMPDGALIMKAYEKWGTDCPAYLLGDWVFALWDARKRRLFVARDHYGVTGLYYYQSNRTFVFASSLKGILALPNVPHRLNPSVIARYAPGFDHDASTPYEGFFRLTPAHAMMVTADKTETHRYWHPKEAPAIRFRSDQDYLHAFLEIYTESVRCRLRSHRPVGIALSGGLDSGSLATLAARELTRAGQRLFAFSSVPQYDVSEVVPAGRCGDETSFIQAISQTAENIDLTLVKAEDVSLLAGIERTTDILEQPECSARNAYWLVSLLEMAQEKNVGTLLSGWGGNLTVSWAGNRGAYLRALLKKGRLGTFIREVAAWQEFKGVPIWHAFLSQVVKPFVPPEWARRYRPLDDDRWTPLDMTLAQTLAAGHEKEAMAPYSALEALHLFFRHGRPGFIEFELGAAFELEFRQPTMDKRVIEFCLGIPQDQFTRDGQTRLLIRRAMTGLMPERVLWSECRGLQGSDIGQRARASRAEIEMALQKLETSSLAQRFLDLPRMTDVFVRVQHTLDPTTTSEVGAILLRGLNIGLYLQRFENDDLYI